MKAAARILILLIASAMPAALQAKAMPHEAALRAVKPEGGRLLFGAYPGGRTGEEDDIAPADVTAFERAAGRRVDWVMFSHNWYRTRAFPAATVRWIRKRGAIPYIRLMLRSDPETDHREPRFTLSRIARGDFDADLSRWMRAAARFGTPIIAEYGTEMNGAWFPWNGRWNGRQKGPARFVAAYRHIIDLARANGASNVIWVFHVNWSDDPQKRWNRFENYYPGDQYIDWLGVSLYSMQGPEETDPTPFSAIEGTMKRLHAMAPAKPVIIAEFGTDVHNPHEPAAAWAEKALRLIHSGRWPALIGYSWWNETWQNDDTPAHDTDMRLTSDPALARTFRRWAAR